MRCNYDNISYIDFKKISETRAMKKKIILGITAALFAAAVGTGFAVPLNLSEPANEPAEGIKPFSSSSQIGCNYYRIPAMITAKDGTIVASIDARYAGTNDSPNDIDIAVSYSTDNAQTWSEPSLALSFDEWQHQKNILKTTGSLFNKKSSSAIDTSLLVDNKTGRIFLLVDAFPPESGAMFSEQSSGYTEIDGKKYLMLRKKGEKDYNYTVRENGVIYNNNGEKTKYSINSKNELFEDSQPMTVRQKKLDYWYFLPYGIPTNEKVPMNIMYDNALFQPMKTSYLYLLYSDDNGKTWSDPVDLNKQVKPNDAGFMGVCPGRGLQIAQGDNADRLLFTTYFIDPETGAQKFTSIYSDDHGTTWSMGNPIVLDEEIGNMSETQLVEMPDGSIMSFSRSTKGNVTSSYSSDGGVTWGKPQAETEIPLSEGGCMVSAINYTGKIDGKDAILLSAPAGNGRKNGFIYVGLITETANADKPYKIDWKYKKEITPAETYFAYSCMTQLPNGDIAILYEEANTAQTVDTVVLKTFSVSELCETAM